MRKLTRRRPRFVPPRYSWPSDPVTCSARDPRLASGPGAAAGGPSRDVREFRALQGGHARPGDARAASEAGQPYRPAGYLGDQARWLLCVPAESSSSRPVAALPTCEPCEDRRSGSGLPRRWARRRRVWAPTEGGRSRATERRRERFRRGSALPPSRGRLEASAASPAAPPLSGAPPLVGLTQVPAGNLGRCSHSPLLHDWGLGRPLAITPFGV